MSRLPYDRVDINASTPITFASNDVVRISFSATSKTIVCLVALVRWHIPGSRQQQVSLLVKYPGICVVVLTWDSYRL